MTAKMTDEELATFLGIGTHERRLEAIARLTPKRRAAFERMKRFVDDRDAIREARVAERKPGKAKGSKRDERAKRRHDDARKASRGIRKV